MQELEEFLEDKRDGIYLDDGLDCVSTTLPEIVMNEIHEEVVGIVKYCAKTWPCDEFEGAYHTNTKFGFMWCYTKHHGTYTLRITYIESSHLAKKYITIDILKLACSWINLCGIRRVEFHHLPQYSDPLIDKLHDDIDCKSIQLDDIASSCASYSRVDIGKELGIDTTSKAFSYGEIN